MSSSRVSPRAFGRINWRCWPTVRACSPNGPNGPERPSDRDVNALTSALQWTGQGDPRARAQGASVLERAVLEHNLLSSSKVYTNIHLTALGELLAVSADRV